MKGRYRYDPEYDTLTYRLDGRYARSLELDDVVLDLDPDGAIIGLRVFEASSLFGLDRANLAQVSDFRFSAQRADGVVSIDVSFVPLSNGEPLLRQRQSIVRDLDTTVPIDI